MQSLAFVKKIFVNFGKENIDRDSKIKNEDHIKISKYRNIFAIGYTPNWSEEVFVNKSIKKKCLGCMSLMTLMVKNLLKRFMKNRNQKRNQSEFRVEKSNPEKR